MRQRGKPVGSVAWTAGCGRLPLPAAAWVADGFQRVWFWVGSREECRGVQSWPQLACEFREGRACGPGPSEVPAVHLTLPATTNPRASGDGDTARRRKGGQLTGRGGQATLPACRVPQLI